MQPVAWRLLPSGGSAASSETGDTSSSSAASAGAVAAGGKTLVVYYSGTGRTERVAKVIAKERQADIMKLVPYPDYTRRTSTTMTRAAA